MSGPLELPPELQAQSYGITVPDMETGEPITARARFASEPDERTVRALTVLAQMAVCAARDGTLPDEAYD